MNSFDVLKETIREYLEEKNPDDELYVKKIKSLFYLFTDDINKSIAFELIINNLKNKPIFPSIFKEILDNRKTFLKDNVFYAALSKTDGIPALLNHYKKIQILLDNNPSLKELEKIDDIMHLIDILKSLATNDYLKAPVKKEKSYAKTKVIKRLKNIDLKYNKLLEKLPDINDLNNYKGLAFHLDMIKGNTDFDYTTNDKRLIRYYIEKQNLTKRGLIKDELIIYILSCSEKVPFIKEMKNLIKEKYKSIFDEIRLEQLSLVDGLNKFDLDSINKFATNSLLTGDIININLANILIRKHLLKQVTLTKNVLINCLKSIQYEYIHTFNIEDTALLIHTHKQLGTTYGYHNQIFKIIGLNDNLLDDFIKNRDVKLLNTIFHELTHAYQARKIVDHKDYLIQKEVQISNYYKYFYHKNYYTIYYEIDARGNGAVETSRYLKQIVPEISKQYEDLYIKQIEIENKNLNLASIKKSPYKKGYGIDSVDNIFEELVEKHPQIIRRNEIFKLEFNNDGSKKGLKEMLSNYSNMSDNERRIMKSILTKRSFIRTYKEVLTEIEESLLVNNEISSYYVNLLLEKYYLKLDDRLIVEFAKKHYHDPKYKKVILKLEYALILKQKGYSKDQESGQEVENNGKTK